MTRTMARFQVRRVCVHLITVAIPPIAMNYENVGKKEITFAFLYRKFEGISLWEYSAMA